MTTSRPQRLSSKRVIEPPRVRIGRTEAARILGPTDATKINRVARVFRNPKRETPAYIGQGVGKRSPVGRKLSAAETVMLAAEAGGISDLDALTSGYRPIATIGEIRAALRAGM
jgi:hypothetical protein